MSRKLRLFGLRPTTSFQQIDGMHFVDQGIARKERDRMNGINGVQYVVCPGPDHKKYDQWLIEMKRLAEEEKKT